MSTPPRRSHPAPAARGPWGGARLCCIDEIMRRTAAIVVLASLALAAPAAAALVPHFDRRVAGSGERVTVTLGSGVELFPAPLHVYFVPIGREHARDSHIETLRAGTYGFITTQRFRFRVPAVPPGRYTLAILVRARRGAWHNIMKGLWRAPNLAPYLILRVR